MWDEIQMQCSDAYEIAEALFKNEVSLVQLESEPVFAAKASLVEEAVWELCKSKNDYQCYIAKYPDGKHKLEIEKLMWHEALEKHSVYGYVRYLDDYYPQGIHVEEAQILKRKCEEQERMIKYVLWLEEERRRMKDAIKMALSSDPNVYPLSFLSWLSIAPSDLEGVLRDSKGEVRDEVLNRYSWDKHSCANSNFGNTPESLPAGTTEVYFWGIPSAGHTCIIAAIMNAAKRMGLVGMHSGKDLPELFSLFDDDPATPVISLPDYTQVKDIRSLPLNMIEYKGGGQIEHTLSIIENSGEVFKCFAEMAKCTPFTTGYHEAQHLMSILQGKNNPKYHFFIIDAKPGLYYRHQQYIERQQQYLEKAVRYFKQAGLFNETTQGISIIVTKCDELSPVSSEWPRLATEYVRNNYPALVNELQQIVGPKRHGGLGINDGTIEIVPFSIGEVFLQQLCLFNPEPAKALVDVLMRCAKGSEL